MSITQENVRILDALNQHTSDVTCCDFAPNFTLITGSSDKTVRVWKWLPGTGYVESSYSPLRGHKYGVTCVRVSPQGSMIASTSIDGNAILWNLHSGLKIYTMVQMNGDAIRVCRFAPDSSILATAGDNGAICIWDLVHRGLIRTIFHHEGSTQSLAFTPDTQYLISACSLEVIRVWCVQELIDTTNDGACASLASVDNAHDLGILCIDVSSIIVTHESDPFVKYYRLASSANSQDIKIWTITSHTAPKHKMASNEVAIENTASFIGHKSAVTCVKYNSSGGYLISSSLDKYVKIWDGDGACVATLRGHTRYVNCVSFSRDGALAASGSNDKTVIVWDLSGAVTRDTRLVKSFALIGNPLQNLQEMQVVRNAETSETFELLEKIDDIADAAINSCCFHDSTLLATGSSDKMVRLLKIEENNNIEETNASPLDGHTYCVNHVEFSRDGSKLATCSLDGCTVVWDPHSGEKIFELVQSSLAVRDCRFSPDGAFLVTAGDDEKANTWDMETGESLTVFEGHSDAVTSTCFSPDGLMIATTSNNGDFRLWRLTGDSVHVQDDANDLGIQSCDFSPNLEPMPTLAFGTQQHYLLATCGNDSLVKLWKISVPKYEEETACDCEDMSVKVWRVLQGHGGSVTCVRFSPQSGELVCSTATDRQSRLWSVYSAECLHVLDHDSIVTSCAFSADSLLLATGCLDRTLWMWRLPPQLIVRSSLFNKMVGTRRKLIVNWSTEDVVRWLRDIDFSSVVPNVVNASLDGQKILTVCEEDICSGLDLSEEETERLRRELRWLKMDEQQPSSSSPEVPQEFLCPITQEVMREPVTCSDGFTYEKRAITEWFMSGKYTSPMTNEKLASTDYAVNQELRFAIHTFLYA